MSAGGSIARRLDAVSIPLPVIIRVFLGVFFLYAGINKAVDPIEFLKAVRGYGVLPETPAIFLNATAVVLPWLEIVCGVGLVLGVLRRGAGTLIALMLCVFSPAILLRALAMMNDKGLSLFEVEFDCGCGTGHEIIWVKLLENAGLLLLSLWIVFSQCRSFEVAAFFSRRRGPAKSVARRGPTPRDHTDDHGGGGEDHSPVPVSSSDVA